MFKHLRNILPGAKGIGTKFWNDLLELSLGSNSNPIIWEAETDWKTSKAVKKPLNSTILWGNAEVTATYHEVWKFNIFKLCDDIFSMQLRKRHGHTKGIGVDKITQSFGQTHIQPD